MVAPMPIEATQAVAHLVAEAIGDDTHEQVGERGGPSSPTLSKILAGGGSTISRATARKLETAFGWPAGTVAAVARGGEPPNVAQGQRLRAARESHGMSPDELVKVLGVGPRTLERWEQGQRIPESVIDRLRSILAVTPSTELLAELQRRADG